MTIRKGRSGFLLFCLCLVTGKHRDTFKNKAESLIVTYNKSVKNRYNY